MSLTTRFLGIKNLGLKITELTTLKDTISDMVYEDIIIAAVKAPIVEDFENNMVKRLIRLKVNCVELCIGEEIKNEGNQKENRKISGD